LKTKAAAPAVAARAAAVETQDLRHLFPPAGGKGEWRMALVHLSLAVPEGDIFGLLGPNGGGKTTLFRILSTALKPTGGRARVFGLDVVQDAALVRRKIGVVFQEPSLDKKLTVRENLRCHGALYGLRGAALSERMEELLGRFRLLDRAGEYVETLSGGMRRRVEIAKGLLHKPALLLMDEPSTGLDPAARIDLWTLLAGLKKDGVTVLLTTHLMEEADKCDRLAILSHGRRVAFGTPAEMKSRIGGDVLTILSLRPDELARNIRQKFNIEAKALDGQVRVEREEGHTLIPQLVEAFPGLVQSVTLGKPTLEDVFIHLTGHRFGDDGPAKPAGEEPK